MFLEILAFWQIGHVNRKVGHCDLILLHFATNSAIILIILKTKVPLMLHTKFQPNIWSHSGEKVDFIGFAVFSIGGYLGFSTRLNLIMLKP